MGSLAFLKYFLILPAAFSNGNDYQGYLLADKGGRCVGLPNFIPFMCRFFKILGALFGDFFAFNLMAVHYML